MVCLLVFGGGVVVWGGLNKLKLSYFPFSLFFGQKLWPWNFRGLAHTLSRPTCKGCVGSFEDLQLDAGSVCSFRPASSGASARRERHPKPCCVSHSAAGQPLALARRRRCSGWDLIRKCLACLPFLLWWARESLLVRWIRSCVTGSDGLWLVRRATKKLLRS